VEIIVSKIRLLRYGHNGYQTDIVLYLVDYLEINRANFKTAAIYISVMVFNSLKRIKWGTLKF
jgi:hypothetical protein